MCVCVLAQCEVACLPSTRETRPENVMRFTPVDAAALQSECGAVKLRSPEGLSSLEDDCAEMCFFDN